MDSDAESSPWDSPLSSARDPVKRNEQKKNKPPDPAPESPWDSDEERTATERSAQRTGAPVPKQNNSWVNSDLNNSRLPRPAEESGLPVSRKHSLTQDPKLPPFNDFKEAMPASPENEGPGKSVGSLGRGSMYKTREPEQGQDFSSWGRPAKEKDSPRRGVPPPASSMALYDSVSPPDSARLATGSGAGNRTEMQSTERQLTGQSERRAGGCPQRAPGVGRIKTDHELAAEQQEEVKAPKYTNYGGNTDSVYVDIEQVWEKAPKVSVVTEVACYKDDLHMYQFDYGHKHYYQARKDLNKAFMEKLADSAEKMILRGWREVFGVLRILASLVTIFLVELLCFLSKHIFQVLVVGLLTVTGDHVVKPLLVALFNSFLQPLLIFLLNLLSSVRSLCLPLLDILRGLTQQLAAVLGALRLVEVHTGPASSAPRAQEV